MHKDNLFLNFLLVDNVKQSFSGQQVFYLLMHVFLCVFRCISALNMMWFFNRILLHENHFRLGTMWFAWLWLFSSVVWIVPCNRLGDSFKCVTSFLDGMWCCPNFQTERVFSMNSIRNRRNCVCFFLVCINLLRTKAQIRMHLRC